MLAREGEGRGGPGGGCGRATPKEILKPLKVPLKKESPHGHITVVNILDGLMRRGAPRASAPSEGATSTVVRPPDPGGHGPGLHPRSRPSHPPLGLNTLSLGTSLHPQRLCLVFFGIGIGSSVGAEGLSEGRSPLPRREGGFSACCYPPDPLHPFAIPTLCGHGLRLSEVSVAVPIRVCPQYALAAPPALEARSRKAPDGTRALSPSVGSAALPQGRCT